MRRCIGRRHRPPVRRYLSRVPFCDSSGLAVLVGIQHRSRAQGITLALANLRSHTSRVLCVTLDRDLQMMA
ncbi:STAS domain-containing protein [Nonomuraea diastatica]|uniref:Anti-sigma factor antagonist n=1 Tax=Nonomuraea diastatica TaxID=1848329 RepID=A0A4R4VG79_9ACTN|nr:anti-sigma factor antagonist [Nonomuraea diastatica]